ncbi:hypothetical protein [Scytonema sp. NUACC26]|uniref:hypothetical protein n=1 Tax=Scytonema sp. NUACC26 TaxID=3140176 RepID=UPI0034DC867B
MSDKRKLQNSDLLIDLSEQEQEVATGGRLSSQDFSLQLTQISSYAKAHFSTGNTSFTQKAAYTLTQLTLGLNFSSKGSNRRRRRSRGWSDEDLLLLVILSLVS